jgi:hypothetical protein
MKCKKEQQTNIRKKILRDKNKGNGEEQEEEISHVPLFRFDFKCSNFSIY